MQVIRGNKNNGVARDSRIFAISSSSGGRSGTNTHIELVSLSFSSADLVDLPALAFGFIFFACICFLSFDFVAEVLVGSLSAFTGGAGFVEGSPIALKAPSTGEEPSVSCSAFSFAFLSCFSRFFFSFSSASRFAFCASIRSFRWASFSAFSFIALTIAGDVVNPIPVKSTAPSSSIFFSIALFFSCTQAWNFPSGSVMGSFIAHSSSIACFLASAAMLIALILLLAIFIAASYVCVLICKAACATNISCPSQASPPQTHSKYSTVRSLSNFIYTSSD
mmetsp:Transcript_15801/g.25722  ORF Transcript_15801/g.25722 Transcript_15801/m.25722 type:complete len:278 (-) Transcript_15801:200-1033(-)